jgi:hypothetical protein
MTLTNKFLDMQRKIVKKRFHVTTTTKKGKIFAEVGDILTISNRGSEYYNIIKINKTNIFSRWMRKAWIDCFCE